MRKFKKKFNKIQSLFLALLIFGTMLTPYARVFAATDQTANPDLVRSLALSYKNIGDTTFTNLVSPYNIPDSSLIDTFRARYSFNILDNIDINGDPVRTVHEGDFYIIDLPDLLVLNSPVGGVINGNGGAPIANYTFIEDSIDHTWKVRVEFTDYVDDLAQFNIFGNLEFDFTLDLSSVVAGETEIIYIPIDDNNGINLVITTPEPPDTTPISLAKSVTSYTPSTRTIIWNINMLPETATFSGCTFTDTLDVSKVDLVSLKHGAVNLVQGTDYTYNATTGLITYLIPMGRDGASFQNIIITATAKRDLYGTSNPTIINNQANLSGGVADVNINSNTSEYTITPDWLSKSGAVIEGNKIQWTISANNSGQDMYNAVITDNISADLVLDKTSVKIGTTTVPIYDNAHTPANTTEIYGVYVANGNGTATLKIYLPRGLANASNAVQTVTMVTSVVAPTTVTPTPPTYNNTASIDANFVGDGNGVGTYTGTDIGIIGVNIPNVSIDKNHQALSADDKRDGTITWTFTAVSNLSTYGKSQIIDTLPADQEYVAGEIKWGSMNINATTEPKAEITNAGRTLTITFATANALQTPQAFSVKTRIIDSTYDKNLNRAFTNQVRVAIFSNLDVELAASSDSDSITVVNNVITKNSSTYNGNTTGIGQNPRVNFNIVINDNLMELRNLKIEDDLSQILTEFKKSSESTFTNVSGVKWTYVPGSISITKNAGTRDSLDLTAIINAATYSADILSVDFGNGVTVNDKYTISFTAELDVSQDPIFKENGVIRTKGNVAKIESLDLDMGSQATPPTGVSVEIRNELLSKYGVHLVAEQQAQWTINLNQHHSELNSTRVVDVLPLGLTLDPTSIKLYTNVIGTNGNFITGSTVESQGVSVPFTYTYALSTELGQEGRYVLTVDLPDNSKAYILRFTTDIANSLLGTQINNTAYYVGQGAAEENGSATNLVLSGTSGGGSTTKTSITVNKFNSDNSAILNGATFALNWLRNGDPADQVFVRNLTTADGKAVFKGLSLGETYTITEVGTPSGYIIDSATPVLVVVPDNITGAMDPIDFFNTPVKTGTWNPTALKDLSGKEFVRPFNFEILDNDTKVFTGVTNSLQPGGRYNVVFSLDHGIAPEQLLNFSDDHKFNSSDPVGTEYLVASKTLSMRESNTQMPGYVLDDNSYEFVVKAYNVKGQEALKIQIEDGSGNVISDDQGNFNPANIPVFFNTYSATGDFNFNVNKTLIGHKLTAGLFNFSLYEDDTLLQTATNEAGVLNTDGSYTGSVNFNTLSFTQADVGIKTFIIVEENTNKAGYTYDTSIYTVRVLITDNDDGTVSSSIQSIIRNKDNSNENADSINFVNSYAALNFKVSKFLTGKVLKDNEFSFTLQQLDFESGAKIGDPVIGHNDAMGDVTFKDVTFDLTDIGQTFYFSVTEVNDKQNFVTYDNTEYSIKAEVLQNDDGTLYLKQDLFKANGINLTAVDDFKFYNTFIPKIPQTGGTLLPVMLIGSALTIGGFLIVTKLRKSKVNK